MKNIILIGSGNVATHLGLSLVKKGYKIVQVWSRKLKNAERLAKRLNSNATDSINKLKHVDLYIVSVKDDVTESIITQLNRTNVVHTSGNLGINIFKNKFKKYGVFYPLQTFKKEIPTNISNTPICIESNNKEFEKGLVKIGRSLSKKTIIMNSEQRKKIHIAAVFSCNFTNHMFSIADNILTQEGTNFKLLLPLINQTIKQLENNKPSKVQTGPAKRNDIKTINDHINSLSDQNTQAIYQLISKSIIDENE